LYQENENLTNPLSRAGIPLKVNFIGPIKNKPTDEKNGRPVLKMRLFGPYRGRAMNKADNFGKYRNKNSRHKKR
jgi:hypothetical protein